MRPSGETRESVPRRISTSSTLPSGMAIGPSGNWSPVAMVRMLRSLAGEAGRVSRGPGWRRRRPLLTTAGGRYDRSMQRSERYILTTHAGSLPRPPGLVDMYVRLSRREPVDAAALAAAVEESTQQVVRRQLEAGVDVGNDGEQARESFFTYVQHRMSGFGGTSDRQVMRDIVHYRSFLELKLPEFARPMVSLTTAPKAIGEVRYVDRVPLEQECAQYLRILAAAPMLNEHYPRYADYVVAVADALRTEYEYIVSQGFVLQLDCPDLAMERHTSFADRPLEDF